MSDGQNVATEGLPRRGFLLAASSMVAGLAFGSLPAYAGLPEAPEASGDPGFTPEREQVYAALMAAILAPFGRYADPEFPQRVQNTTAAFAEKYQLYSPDEAAWADWTLDQLEHAPADSRFSELSLDEALVFLQTEAQKAASIPPTAPMVDYVPDDVNEAGGTVVPLLPEDPPEPVGDALDTGGAAIDDRPDVELPEPPDVGQGVIAIGMALDLADEPFRSTDPEFATLARTSMVYTSINLAEGLEAYE
jgi:hypothetical protein